jgi:arsenate reductase
MLTAAVVLALFGFAHEFQNPASQTVAAPPHQTVLFVCEHGAAKSVIAAAYFDKLARERGLPYRAVFRGSTPDPELSPATRAGLTKEGFDVRTWAPSLVTARDVEQAARVVVFAAPLPGDAAASKVSDWNDVTAAGSGYDALSGAIRTRVEQLIEQLAAKN